MQKVLVIVGPTASGKSALAVTLAKKFNGEVISADSRQVYKGLNIGTGKITKKEMLGIPHHLLDIASPRNVFSVSDFVHLGQGAIEDIASRGKLPIICGGTGFYIDALVGRVQVSTVPPNKPLRNSLHTKTAPELYDMLQHMDPERAKTIDRQNPVRLVRAIEIASAIGSVPVIKTRPRYKTLWIGIEWKKDALQTRIHTRLLERMKKGMKTESVTLHTNGLSFKRMHELGLEYGALADLLQKKISLPYFLVNLETQITQYAKRQMTYWKRNTGIEWIPAARLSQATKLVENFLK